MAGTKEHGGLQGETAVITGAASGIGRGIAIRFAQEGAYVALWDVNPSTLARTAEEIRDLGGKVSAHQVDISDSSSIAAAARATSDLIGSPGIIVNNAGVHDDYAGALDADETLWDCIVRINLKAVWLVSRAFLPGMVAAGRGKIINIASIASLTANGGGVAYTAAKHGVLGLTRRMALEFADRGINVNAIAPGAVDTGITAGLDLDPSSPVMQRILTTPAARMADPSEIAAAARFLASDESSFCHGSLITVDGGWMIR